MVRIVDKGGEQNYKQHLKQSTYDAKFQPHFQLLTAYAAVEPVVRSVEGLRRAGLNALAINFRNLYAS